MPNLEFPCNLSLGHTARCQLQHAAALVIRDRLATPIFPICFSFGDAFSLPLQHHLPFELGNTSQGLPFTLILDRKGGISLVKLGTLSEEELDRKLADFSKS